jgi:hypothetical protein
LAVNLAVVLAVVVLAVVVLAVAVLAVAVLTVVLVDFAMKWPRQLHHRDKIQCLVKTHDCR